MLRHLLIILTVSIFTVGITACLPGSSVLPPVSSGNQATDPTDEAPVATTDAGAQPSRVYAADEAVVIEYNGNSN